MTDQFVDANKMVPESSMTDLSPAALVVLDALCMDELNGPQQLMARAHAATALRAVAQQLPDVVWDGCIKPGAEMSIGINWSRDALHAIAAELEGSND